MAKLSLSSNDLVKIVLPSLRHVAELMGASVFLAVGTGSGNKFVYSSGYLKEVYEQGNLRPSSSDINLMKEKADSCRTFRDEEDSSCGGNEDPPPRKRHRKSRKSQKRGRSHSISREEGSRARDEDGMPVSKEQFGQRLVPNGKLGRLHLVLRSRLWVGRGELKADRGKKTGGQR